MRLSVARRNTKPSYLKVVAFFGSIWSASATRASRASVTATPFEPSEVSPRNARSTAASDSKMSGVAVRGSTS